MGTTYRTNLQLHPAEIPENTHKTRKNTEIRLDFSILGVEICSGHQNSLERSFEPLLRGIFSQVCLVGRATNRGSRASFGGMGLKVWPTRGQGWTFARLCTTW